MREARHVALAVGAGAAGMAFHTVAEFGWPALFAPSSGFLPVVAVQAALLLAWGRVRSRGLLLALAATGVLQLVGGAILTVLPLPFLPFAPEQSVGHYVSHAVYGLAQLPLAALAFFRDARDRPGTRAR